MALTNLELARVNLAQILQANLDKDGEVLDALKHDTCSAGGADELDILREKIKSWRTDCMRAHQMVPRAILEEYMLVKIVYASASQGNGQKMG